MQSLWQNTAIIFVVAQRGHRRSGLAHKGVAAVNQIIEPMLQLLQLAAVADAEHPRLEIAI